MPFEGHEQVEVRAIKVQAVEMELKLRRLSKAQQMSMITVLVRHSCPTVFLIAILQFGQLLKNTAFGRLIIISTLVEKIVNMYRYTRKNAQVATDLQTSCNKSVYKLLTRCIRTACSEFVGTSLEQAVDKLQQA